MSVGAGGQNACGLDWFRVGKRNLGKTSGHGCDCQEGWGPVMCNYMLVLWPDPSIRSSPLGGLWKFMRNKTRNYVKLIIHANCSFASMTAKDSDTLMNERYDEAFGLIKCIFNVDELHEDQIKLIKTFVGGKNIYFNVPTGYGKSSIESKSCCW